ncbi:MAG: hypothetical protein ABR527_00105, partial [Gemmatimonadota bacterium]
MLRTKIFIIVFGLMAGTATAQAQQGSANQEGAMVQPPTAEEVQAVLATWKAKPQEVARKMIGKYGQPQEATANVLIWRNNGPWKRTVLI